MIKRNDEEKEVELIYFLLLNNKTAPSEVQKGNDDAKKELTDKEICQFYLCDTK